MTMSLQRATRHSLFLQRSSRPSVLRPTFSNARYYAKGTADTAADGASGKKPEEAEPKLLNRDPPKDEEQPEDVKKHNREVENRADKPAGRATDEDVKNDKVSKGFWSRE